MSRGATSRPADPVGQGAGTTVVHSVPVWLPTTQNWLYTQVAALPASVRSIIACQRTENLDRYGVPELRVASGRAWRAQLGPVLRLLRRRGLAPPVSHVATVARRTGARLVHSHFGHVGWDDRASVARLARRGVGHVVSVYGADVSRLPTLRPHWGDRYARLFADVDLVLCEGSRMARRVRDLGAPADRVRVHHLGIPVADFPFRPRQWRPGEPLRVLMAASFREKKGLPYGVEALGRIAGERPLELTIIGDAPDDARGRAEKARITAAVGAAGLEGATRFLGYQPHARLMEEAYAHHVLVSPSVTASDGDTEGGAPVTLVEMLATGMPVVSTAHADIPEVLGPQVAGALAPERDPAGLVAQLRWLLEREDWSGWLEGGRRHVEAGYDAHRQGRALAGIYAELVSRPSGTRP